MTLTANSDITGKSEEVGKLWAEYKATGDPRKRDRLVLSLAPMVKYIVFRKVREIPVHCEVDDFLSCGLEALIQCIDRYDPSRGATLEQYAWTRVHGAVLDELRRNDWAPRSLRRWEREFNDLRDRFTSIYGRLPSNAELSDAAGISEKELTRLLGDLARADVGSLNTTVSSFDEANPIETIDTLPSTDPTSDPEDMAMRQAAIEDFREAFSQLRPRDRQIAILLHVNELTMRDTGELLGISESRVCQIHGQIKSTLREQSGVEPEWLGAAA